MLPHKTLPREFYARNPKTVAIELLGKILVRRLGNAHLKGIIVETEAYYGIDDPASRAREGMKRYNMPMWDTPGLAFIYNVHNNWMLNVVAHEPNSVGAVLIRALEPLSEIELMMANRRVNNIIKLTSGPGRLTRALKIDKELNCVDLTMSEGPLFIVDGEVAHEIGSSHRIGVRRDLNEELRFYIKGNPFVSVSERRIRPSNQP
ncbi:MAG: DNA-3-methyladenine glycosylase [Candidatus Bathyarchaeia archaeon]